jgi:hypothetical protein
LLAITPGTFRENGAGDFAGLAASGLSTAALADDAASAFAQDDEFVCA